jgi:hypothetical protein
MLQDIRRIDKEITKEMGNIVHGILSNQAIWMRFGASSGVDLGNVTVRTPFSMDALISSSLIQSQR